MKSITKYTIHLLLAILFVTSCTKDAEVGILPVISGLEDEYVATTNQTLEFAPTITGANDVTFSWLLNGVEESTAPTYTFHAPNSAGLHTLMLRASSSTGIAQKAISIEVGKNTAVNLSVNNVLPLETPKSLAGKTNIKWEVSKASSELYRLGYSEDGMPLFIAAKPGKYQVKATADDLEFEYLILARQGEEKQTPYIAKVFDYLPAPGQFVNKLPEYKEGDTHEDMVAKVANNLVGENTSMITLGGWGGYVTIGFDHTIVNIKGKMDFTINGNAFGAAANPRPDTPFGGSCEPGIIMVAYDKNKNGKPDDDEWYEIKGSGNFTAENEPWYEMAVNNKNDVRTFRDYEMTYYRPINDVSTTISEYIRWTDNKGQEGYKVKNGFHGQSYYPAWVDEDQITYKGIRLADNGIDESGVGNYFVLYAYRYGYVDNFPNGHAKAGIDIDWAIDKNGNPANLPGIDFVKIYNGVDKENGWLGECSTEVDGGYDLHMMGKSFDTIEID
ncbi:MAG: PKD-like domain-containing protein [Fermentimonas sp.]|jgi:hypothetical protein